HRDLVAKIGLHGNRSHVELRSEKGRGLLRFDSRSAVMHRDGVPAGRERRRDTRADALLPAAGHQRNLLFAHRSALRSAMTSVAPSVGTGMSSVTHVLHPANSGRSTTSTGRASLNTRTFSTNSPGVR